jgi:hypothetical protein
LVLMTTEGFMGWYLQRSRFAQTCGRISIHFFIDDKFRASQAKAQMQYHWRLGPPHSQGFP